MKKQFLLIIIIIVAGLQQTSFSQNPNTKQIDVNNINAAISANSDLFWDFNNASFEVPIGSGKHSIFAGGLWIGGLDNGGNIHLAAQTYRQTGVDFWPGPIDTIGTAGPTNFLNYNTPWKINKSEVISHQQNWNTPNYIVPSNIAEWPGFDTTVQRVIAPFADYNGNGIYDPQNGDYPYILGDQSVYAVFNDWYSHTESGCDYMGIEVHREFFGFDAAANTPLDNSIFSRYEVKNFSNNDYHDVFITIWTDFDLGNATDDYVGTDIGLNMVYAYNGDPDDETAAGYGLNPPACGVYFLNQNLAGSVAYLNQNNQPVGNPGACNDFNNYNHSIWLDNQPITYGGDGRNPGNPVTNYMYPGITDTIYYPAFGAWDEAIAGNTPEDRRIIGSIGPFNINAGEVMSFDVGYTWARAISGGPLASVAELQNAVSNLRLMYSNGTLTSAPQIPNPDYDLITVYPNPASDSFTLNNHNSGKVFDLVVLDATGRTIYQKNHISNSLEEVDIRSFSPGIYIVKVTREGKIYNQKLIINK